MLSKTEIEERFGILISDRDENGNKIKIICKICGEPTTKNNTFDGEQFFCIEHFEEGINVYKKYFEEVTGQNPDTHQHCQAKDLKKNIELVGFTEWDLNTLKGRLHSSKKAQNFCHRCIHSEVCDARKSVRSLLFKFPYWGYTDHIPGWVNSFLGHRCKFFIKKEDD